MLAIKQNHNQKSFNQRSNVNFRSTLLVEEGVKLLPGIEGRLREFFAQDERSWTIKLSLPGGDHFQRSAENDRAIENALSHPIIAVKAQGVALLGYLRDPKKAVELIRKYINWTGPGYELNQNAIKSIGHISDPQLAACLIREFFEKSTNQNELVKSIGHIKDPKIAASLLRELVPDIRRTFSSCDSPFSAINHINDPETVVALYKEYLGQSANSEPIKIVAANHAARIKNPKIRDVVIRELEAYPDEKFREYLKEAKAHREQMSDFRIQVLDGEQLIGDQSREDIEAKDLFAKIPLVYRSIVENFISDVKRKIASLHSSITSFY